MNRHLSWITALVLCSALGALSSVAAQSRGEAMVEIPLEIGPWDSNVSSVLSLTNQNREPLKPGEELSGNWDGLAYKVLRREDDSQPVDLWVDRDGDETPDEPVISLEPDQEVPVTVRCRLGGARECRLMVKLNYDDDHIHRILRRPTYAAHGRLEMGECSIPIVFRDFTADGRFDTNDLRRGTALGLDFDQDGRIYGRREHVGVEVFLACGKVWMIDDIDSSRAVLRLSRAGWPLPESNEPMAPLAFQLRDGGQLELASLQGRLTVLDFWATWCGPCVAAMPKLEEMHTRYGDRLQVLGLILDNRPDKEKEILQKAGVTYPNHALRDGEFDTAYRVLRSAHRSIPLYIVLDEDSRFIAGLSDAEELAALIKERLPEP